MYEKNRAKEYYINNKESTRKHIKNKYESLTEVKKQKMKEYQKEYRKNMTDEQNKNIRLLMNKNKNIKKL